MPAAPANTADPALHPLTLARVPVPGGTLYRIVSSAPARTAVVPALAQELARAFELFAQEAGATAAAPIPILLGPGIFGHHQVGRAADIYGVGGQGFDAWWRRWEQMLARAARAASPLERRLIRETEEKENLGWRLYLALARHGRWAQPYGHPIQLFGPWTRTEGPWRFISDFLLNAHRDHIHVAK